MPRISSVPAGDRFSSAGMAAGTACTTRIAGHPPRLARPIRQVPGSGPAGKACTRRRIKSGKRRDRIEAEADKNCPPRSQIRHAQRRSPRRLPPASDNVVPLHRQNGSAGNLVVSQSLAQRYPQFEDRLSAGESHRMRLLNKYGDCLTVPHFFVTFVEGA
jgi:hypothetical protein